MLPRVSARMYPLPSLHEKTPVGNGVGAYAHSVCGVGRRQRQSPASTTPVSLLESALRLGSRLIGFACRDS